MNDYNFIINKKILYGKENNIDNNIIDYNEVIKLVSIIRTFDNIMWKFINKGRLIIYNYYNINNDILSEDYIKHVNKYLSNINKNIIKISSCYSYNFDIFYIFKLYNLKRYKKYLILGTNPCNAECINYYTKSHKITFIQIYSPLTNESINNKIIENVNKKVKNINTTTFDKLKKYECIIFNIISSYITTFEEYSNFQTIKDIELSNLNDFERAYILLDNIELNGTLILYTSTIITDKVLLILENIGLCFVNTFIYKAFSSSYKIIQWVVIVFENFKGIKEKRETNSQNFILSIKDFFDENNKIYKTVIDNYNFLSSVITNRTLFEYIIDKNLLFSYEVYKFLQFPSVNINKLQLKIIINKLNNLINIEQNILNFDNIKNKEFIINYNYIKITEIEDFSKKLDLLNNLLDNNKNIIKNESKTFFLLVLKLLGENKYWINLYEILKVTNIINDNDNIFYLSENYESLLDATESYCKNNKLKFKHNHAYIDILNEDYIKKYKDKCKNSDLIIVDCDIKKYNDKILAYFAQVLFVLNNTKKNGNAIIKFKLYFNKNIIFYIVYLLSLFFDNIYFYKPTINLYKKFYIICKNRNNFNKDLQSEFNILINKNVDKTIHENYSMNYLDNFISNYKILINKYTNIIYSTLYFSNYWNILNENNKNIIHKFLLNKVKEWKNKFLNNEEIIYNNIIKNKDGFIKFANRFLDMDIKPFFTSNELQTFFNICKNIKNKNKESNKSFENIKKLLKDVKINNNVLVDIGCGSGVLTNLIKKEYKFNTVHCFETNNYINPKFNDIEINMIKNSVINLPDKSVDLILCNFSLHHIKEINKMIDEIKRILKSDGYLIIQEHDNTSDKQKELLDFYHYINYLLLVDIKDDDFETLYYRFQNEYYSNYTSKKNLNNMFQNYKIINEIDINAGFVTNYLQLLNI
jgi:ubiquinone/menaquinone biosynthesis C-methylase UbiE